MKLAGTVPPAARANFWIVFGDVMTLDHLIERPSAAAPGVAI
jgi:hypothetical protein